MCHCVFLKSTCLHCVFLLWTLCFHCPSSSWMRFTFLFSGRFSPRNVQYSSSFNRHCTLPWEQERQDSILFFLQTADHPSMCFSCICFSICWAPYTNLVLVVLSSTAQWAAGDVSCHFARVSPPCLALSAHGRDWQCPVFGKNRKLGAF